MFAHVSLKVCERQLLFLDSYAQIAAVFLAQIARSHAYARWEHASTQPSIRASKINARSFLQFSKRVFSASRLKKKQNGTPELAGMTPIAGLSNAFDADYNPTDREVGQSC